MPITHRLIIGHKANKHVKALFKRFVRKVILCKAILNEMDTRIGLNARRNIVILTRRKRSASLLSSSEKLLFFKDIKNRTVTDRENIVKIVANLKCFQTFPPKLRASVAPHLNYIKIESNRDIIREGKTATYVYFILHGEIVIHSECTDIYTKKTYRKERFIVASGDIIGHITFLNKGQKRNFTYTAITDVNCLYLDRDTYIKYLLPYVRKIIEAKYLALSKLYILDTFEGTQRYFVALFGKLKEYQSMETIYYKDCGDLNYVYFIISGQCMILQHLKTKSIKHFNKKKQYFLCQTRQVANHVNDNLNKKNPIYLYKEMQERTSFGVLNSQMSVIQSKFSLTSLMQGETEHFFLDVGTLSYGAMFGLGEPMEDRAIMARTNVQCLLLPRFWLLAKEQNPGNIWQRLQLSFKNVVPSREQLFESFKVDKCWKEFSEEYIMEALDIERNKSVQTKIQNIPLICRIVEYNLHDKDGIRA